MILVKVLKRGIIASLITVTWITVGCTTVGPNYTEQDRTRIQTWETDLYGQLGTNQGQNEADLRFWWRVFEDPVLDRLIELARAENSSLQIAGLRILESRAVAGIAGAARSPQVRQTNGAITYVNTQRSNNRDQDVLNYQAGLAAGWELDFWGKYQRGIEAADAAFMASVANQQNAQVLLVAQVADLYYAYRTTLLRIQIAQHNATIQKRSFEMTERLYKSGQESELDLQQAYTQYMATLSSIPGLEITRAQLRNGLCVLLNRAPGNLPELDKGIQKLPVLDPLAIDAIPAKLLLRRPDVRAAAWAVAAQSAKIGLVEADLYPSISLLGSLGWSGNSLTRTSNAVTLGIGPSLKWNIFDGGLIRNNIRIEDARLQQAIEGFQYSLLSAAQEIDNAAIKVIKTTEQKTPQKASTKAAYRSLELANSRYREGYVNFQRVIDAQRATAVQAERELLNDSNHISAVISLYKSLGGGWVDMPMADLIRESTRNTMETRTNWGDLLSEPLPDGTTIPANTEELENE